MLRVKLIDMPFGSLDYPSLALTQLKFIARKYYKSSIDIDIVYVKHDFALFFGINEYRMIDEVDFHGSNYKTGLYNNGIGEWFPILNIKKVSCIMYLKNDLSSMHFLSISSKNID